MKITLRDSLANLLTQYVLISIPAKQIHKGAKWEQHGLKNGTHVVLPYRVPSAFAQGIMLGTFWVTRRKSTKGYHVGSTWALIWYLC